MATYPTLSPAYTSAQLAEAGDFWLNDYLGPTVTTSSVPLDVVATTSVPAQIDIPTLTTTDSIIA